MEGTGQYVTGSSAALSFRVVTRTDTGLVRDNNEDTIVLGDLTTGAPSVSSRIGPGGLLLGICDGMGGEAAGEVASRLAAESVRKVMTLAQLDLDDQGLAKALAIAVELAGKAVRDYAVEHPKCERMGTTCTVAAIRGSHMVVAHVGDSRAYRVRQGQLEQPTVDQNLANDLLARGHISKEQVPNVVNGKHILQAVGNSEFLEVALVHVDLVPGDRVLMCSDGLSDMVDEGAIAEVVTAANDDLQGMADELVRRAKAAGGRDNISLVLSEVGAVFVSEDAVTQTLPSRGEVENAPARVVPPPVEPDAIRLPMRRWFLVTPLGALMVALVLVWWGVELRGKSTSPSSTSQAVPAAHAKEGVNHAAVVERTSTQDVASAKEAQLPAPAAGRPDSTNVPGAAPDRKAATGKASGRPGKGATVKPQLSPREGDVDDAIRPPDPAKRNPF